MNVLATCGKWLFGEYSLYLVYRSPADHRISSQGEACLLRPTIDDLRQCGRLIVAKQAWYLGSECEAFALADESGIAAVCFYWHGERYKKRGFWPLGGSEAKLVQIVVDPAARGKGLATRLIEASASQMQREGWEALYARIWHTNHASLRAFERAGWTRIALVAELHPRGLMRTLRLQFPLVKPRLR